MSASVDATIHLLETNTTNRMPDGVTTVARQRNLSRQNEGRQETPSTHERHRKRLQVVNSRSQRVSRVSEIALDRDRSVPRRLATKSGTVSDPSKSRSRLRSQPRYKNSGQTKSQAKQVFKYPPSVRASYEERGDEVPPLRRLVGGMLDEDSRERRKEYWEGRIVMIDDGSTYFGFLTLQIGPEKLRKVTEGWTGSK